VIHAQTLAYNTAIPTISIKDGQAGDAVFCHSTGLVGRAIRIGQWIRHFGVYKTWNHIGWLDEAVTVQGVTVDWKVGQAVSRGVTNTALLSKIAPGGKFEIVPMTAFPTVVPNDHLAREILLATLRSQVGVEYGFLTIASIIINILTPKFLHIDFRAENTWICSAVYSWGLHSGGGTVTGDVYQRLPAEVAQSADK
jgi:hypothetical protein